MVSYNIGMTDRLPLPQELWDTIPADAQARIQARLRLMRVSLGREPADAVIVNGTLLNTLTSELLPGWGVAIAGR